ncbi:nucleoside triphosphate pyrophosphohydrolase family protein [Maledivibacter halophilus]|uniref:DUF1573 domain-containing protein n=1 Tax=Maledivibacter halophilus TaxID=36842 RepID=A0A1T5MIA9_9FIRM|nr:DUF1573 domain-containing protein [Maledivibacter halophilus]SKC87940.1 hypothetical protein SAMN02194393_04785 [Maledivibacter halophilus]
MKDFLCDNFQNSVEEVLIRHKSILDILTKLQESSAKINRAVIKSVTSCGCIKINASNHEVPDDINYEDIKEYLNNHLQGELCEVCREKIIEEMGKNLFYITALANNLDINLYEVILEEHKKIEALGKFSLY